jgi:hypothetical protein
MERVKEQGIKRNTVFKNSAYGASHWFPPIKYDGVGLVSTTFFISGIPTICRNGFSVFVDIFDGSRLIYIALPASLIYM